MKIKELFNRQQARYSVKVVVAWLWSIWQGNRLQALLNVLVGVLSVVNSLMQIWAVQQPHATADVRPHFALAVARKGAVSFRRYIESTRNRRANGGEFLNRNTAQYGLFLGNVYRSVPLFDDDGCHTCPTYCGNDTCFHCFK